MQVSEMVTATRQLIMLFQKVEPRPWGIEAMMTELAGEVGTLADSVMIKEGYRQLRDGDTLDLEDDLADVLFMLIRIADHYHINLETTYMQMIQSTQAKLEKRLREVYEGD